MDHRMVTGLCPSVEDPFFSVGRQLDNLEVGEILHKEVVVPDVTNPPALRRKHRVHQRLLGNVPAELPPSPDGGVQHPVIPQCAFA